MKYAYPAVFTVEDEQILVDVPDLPGLHTFGENWAEALSMTQDAIEMWLWDAENSGDSIPVASNLAALTATYAAKNQFVNMVSADTDEYRRQTDTRAVKKTLSIPAWLNYQAEKANAPFSQILQQGLKKYLDVT
jgi:predicted RNase H-like HicB family nuclease